MTITKVPGVEERVETGPLQFGDDWPGVFIRGDHALVDAMTLQAAMSSISFSDDITGEMARSVIEGLISTLSSCRVPS